MSKNVFARLNAPLAVFITLVGICAAQGDPQTQQPPQQPPQQAPPQDQSQNQQQNPVPAQPQSPVLVNGTQIQIRMNQPISSDKAQAGDRFTGTLAIPQTVNSNITFPVGSYVEGHVQSIKDSGRLSNPGEMELVIDTIRSGNLSATLNTNPTTIKGESHAANNASKGIGGAGLGAIIGAIAGGGRGAAIGAGAGAAAGTGAAAATGKRPAKVATEDIVKFTLATDSVVNFEQRNPYGDPNALSQQSQYPQGQSTPQPNYGNSGPTLQRRAPTDSQPPYYGNSGTGNSGSTAPQSSGNQTSQSPDYSMPQNPGNAPPANSDTAAPPANLGSNGPGLSRAPIPSTFSADLKGDIQQCISSNADSVPASYLKREYGAPPNGFVRGDILTSDQFARVKNLPDVCAYTTQNLPNQRTVGVFNGQVLLLNAVHRVLDSFKLDVN